MTVLRHLGLVAALGASSLSSAATAPDPVRPEPPAADATVEPPTSPSLDVIGFTDAGFSATDADSSTSNSGFFQGQFVLHFTSALSSRIAFFGEISVTSGGGAYGDAGHATANADLHRSILKYSHSDALKLSIGRFHTPISYWNVAFHHGQWLQTTVTRPKMLDFSNPFLPLHFNGAFVEGQLPTGRANVAYLVGLGNGRGSGPGHADAPGDTNNHRAWLARLSAKPDWLRGLEVGAAVHEDKRSAYYGENRADFRERIWSAYAAFTKETPEVIAEYASIGHRRIGRGDSFLSGAYYVQGAWRVSDTLKPYVRWEEIDLDEADHLLEGSSGWRGALVGLRVDVSELVALKAEYHRQAENAAPFRNGAFGQVSLTF